MLAPSQQLAMPASRINSPWPVEIVRYIGTRRKGSDIASHFDCPALRMAERCGGRDTRGADRERASRRGLRRAKAQSRLPNSTSGKWDKPNFGSSPSGPELRSQKLKIKNYLHGSGLSVLSRRRTGRRPRLCPGHLRDLASKAGGPAPDPAPPHAPELTALEPLQGNDCPRALRERRKLRGRIEAWKKTAAQVGHRRPASRFQIAWSIRVAICRTLDYPTAYVSRLFGSNRSLLHEPDPVAPLLKEVGEGLRSELTRRRLPRGREYWHPSASPSWRQRDLCRFAGAPRETDARRSTHGRIARSTPAMGTVPSWRSARPLFDLARLEHLRRPRLEAVRRTSLAAVQGVEANSAAELLFRPLRSRLIHEMEQWLG